MSAYYVQPSKWMCTKVLPPSVRPCVSLPTFANRTREYHNLTQAICLLTFPGSVPVEDKNEYVESIIELLELNE